MKKLLFFFLSCLLFAALLPASHAAESPLIAPAPSSERAALPILDIIGSLDDLTSKEDKVTVEVSYESEELSFSSSATLKWQGASSIQYPKKNYTLTFLKQDGKKNKISLSDAWGKQSKYCLKANWIDPSQARNVVSGRIFNQIIHSRNIDDELSSLLNGGVVDGFPVIIKLNGDFLGLYTLNIPKDKWMFGMDDEGRQALLMGDSWSDSVALLEEISDPKDVAASGWELEYSSTEAERWPDVPCRDENNLEQIMEFTRGKAAYLDSFFDVSINEDLPLLSRESALYLGQTVEFRLPERVLQDGSSISWKITGTKDYTISEDGLTCIAKARHVGKITAEVSLLSSDGSSLTSSSQSVSVHLFPLDARIEQAGHYLKSTWKAIKTMAKTWQDPKGT